MNSAASLDVHVAPSKEESARSGYRLARAAQSDLIGNSFGHGSGNAEQSYPVFQLPLLE
jgi:hypothetical protein